MSMSIEYTHLKQREIMSIGLFSNFCNMSKCAVTLLQLTTLQLLDKFIKQRHKLALNLSVDFQIIMTKADWLDFFEAINGRSEM